MISTRLPNMATDAHGELVRLFVDSVVDYAILVMDPDGRMETWNAGAERLLGYEAGEILGRHFSMLFLPEEIRQHIPEQELEQAATQGRASDDRWLVRKDGGHLWVTGVTIALRDSSLRGFGKIMHDQTQFKQARQQIERLNEDLLQKVKAHEHVVQDLQKSQTDLRETIHELEQFEEVVVGRELKMVSLEKEVERLRRELAERS